MLQHLSQGLVQKLPAVINPEVLAVLLLVHRQNLALVEVVQAILQVHPQRDIDLPALLLLIRELILAQTQLRIVLIIILTIIQAAILILLTHTQITQLIILLLVYPSFLDAVIVTMEDRHIGAAAYFLVL